VNMNNDDILFSEEAWEEDKRVRFNLTELNRSFHEAVPILEATNWHITHVERGYAEIVMPLNVPSTNQFVAHQAAVMLVAADYAGGVALASLFHGVSILGFHKIRKDEGCAYLWGARSSSQWILPSIDDLICRATVDKKVWNRAFSRYKSGKRVLESAHIDMFNGDVKVAEADFTYWVADTDVLRSTADDIERIHPLQSHRLQSSAHLVSGLRAIENRKPDSEKLFSDSYSESAAGKQGIALAERFEIRSPELQPMVASRTSHLDSLVAEFENSGTKYHAISIGAGLDFRRWRLGLKNVASYTECDLPSLQSEKIALAKQNNLVVDSTDHFLNIDLLKNDVFSLVKGLEWISDDFPLLVWWEGGSMYFEESMCTSIMSSISKLLINDDSRFWFDFVSDSLIQDETGHASVEAFNDNMQKMGEPFVNGYYDIKSVLPGLGMNPVDVSSAGQILSDTSPIYGLYSFCTAKGSI